MIASLIFLFCGAVILWGCMSWLRRIDTHALLRSDEKLQNKDALVIGTFFTLMLLLGLCVTGAAVSQHFAEPGSVVLALLWALASFSVGASFGFLLGHPRRLVGEGAVTDGRAGLNSLIRTGLDDIVDWLVKGLTTVMLVESKGILGYLYQSSQSLGAGLSGSELETAPPTAIAFAQALIVFFVLFGALAGCLVTRTYLTGALTRADRSTMGLMTRAGLELGEMIALMEWQRSLGTRGGYVSAEVQRVAEKLAALSLSDLHTAQEFAMWSKAKSMISQAKSGDAERKALQKEALEGYEKAIFECDCDPALLLDYSVALHSDGQTKEALVRLKDAHAHVSGATPEETVKNIYKSLTFSLLYEADGFERVLQLVQEYRDRKNALPSPSLLVNETCAWGQKFRALAKAKALLEVDPATGNVRKPILVRLDHTQKETWPEELRSAFEGALSAMQKVLALDREWKEPLRKLLVSNYPGKAAEHEDDLEAFERFDEFRKPLDLPPWTQAGPEGDKQKAGAEQPAPSGGKPDNEQAEPDPSQHVEGNPVKAEQTPPTHGSGEVSG